MLPVLLAPTVATVPVVREATVARVATVAIVPVVREATVPAVIRSDYVTRE